LGGRSTRAPIVGSPDLRVAGFFNTFETAGGATGISVRVAVEEVKDESETVGGESKTGVWGSSEYSLTGMSTSISEGVSGGDCGCCERGGSEACLVGSPCLRDWRMQSRLSVSSQ
jgi:hypothetical protein